MLLPHSYLTRSRGRPYHEYMNITTESLTDDDLDAVWRRAGRAQDYTMVDFVERALDGDESARRIVASSVRSVNIYTAVVESARQR